MQIDSVLLRSYTLYFDFKNCNFFFLEHESYKSIKVKYSQRHTVYTDILYVVIVKPLCSYCELALLGFV